MNMDRMTLRRVRPFFSAASQRVPKQLKRALDLARIQISPLKGEIWTWKKNSPQLRGKWTAFYQLRCEKFSYHHLTGCQKAGDRVTPNLPWDPTAKTSRWGFGNPLTYPWVSLDKALIFDPWIDPKLYKKKSEGSFDWTPFSTGKYVLKTNRQPGQKTSHSTASKELIKSLVTSFPSTPGPFSMFFETNPSPPVKLEGNFLKNLGKFKDNTPEN